jgi:hypothetical protein
LDHTTSGHTPIQAGQPVETVFENGVIYFITKYDNKIYSLERMSLIEK